MDLEALVGGKHLPLLSDSTLTSGSLPPDDHSSFPDVSDRYNNLKAAWYSLVEAANHGHPQFHVAVTVVLEQLMREQLKKQRKD
jgi:hypothetical protein